MPAECQAVQERHLGLHESRVSFNWPSLCERDLLLDEKLSALDSDETETRDQPDFALEIAMELAHAHVDPIEPAVLRGRSGRESPAKLGCDAILQIVVNASL